MPFHRIAERQLALFHQQHDSRGGDRLGHGMDLENCVGAHGLLVVEVGIAHGLQAGDGAMARHQRDASGDGPLVDEGFHARRNLRQPIGIHACFARVAALPGGKTNGSQYEYSKRSHS